MDISFLYDYLYEKISFKIFDEHDIKRYISDVIDYLELNDYLTDVLFTEDKYVNLAAYNFQYRTIKVSMKAIINEARMVINMMNDKSDYELKINLFILEALIHEIHHVYHNYLVRECDNEISTIFYNQLSHFYREDEQSNNEYESYYNKLIFERDANISAIENILRIIQKHLDNKEIYDYYYNELKKFILAGYVVEDSRIISPFEIVQGELLKLEMLTVEGIDLYDRLKLGFQVSRDEFEYFNDNSDEIILTKNNLHRI